MWARKKKQQDSTVSPRRRRVDTDTQVPTERRTSTFRRNTTIVGSSSRSITSANELNGTILSPRAQAHHLGTHRRRLGLRFVMVLIAALSLYLLVSQIVASVYINTGSTSGGSIDTTPYEKTIDSYYGKNPLSRFYPSLDQAALLRYMQQEHPEVEAASLGLTGQFGKAHLDITLREPVARWQLSGGKTMYVDGNGVVYGVNAYSQPSVTITDDNRIALEKLNKSIIASDRFLAFVGRVVNGFKLQNHTVISGTLPEGTTRQIIIKVDGVSYPIKMTVDRSAGEQVEDASRLIGYMNEKGGITPEYIDVRIKGKAYYK